MGAHRTVLDKGSTDSKKMWIQRRINRRVACWCYNEKAFVCVVKYVIQKGFSCSNQKYSMSQCRQIEEIRASRKAFVCFLYAFPLFKSTLTWTAHWTYFLVFSFFSRAFACCSLMMVALTCGGFMCTFNFPPTRRRTVAANLVWVFSTCGGCFSMMKVLWRQKES